MMNNNIYRQYVEAFKNGNMEYLEAQKTILEDCISRLEYEVERVINWNDSDSVELVNEYINFSGCGYELHLMEEADGFFGRMYLSEAFEYLENGFDMSDSFFTEEGETGNDIFRMCGCDENDIATAAWNEDICYNTTVDMDRIVEEGHEALEALEEAKQEAENQKKKLEAARKLFESVLSLDTVDEVITALWTMRQ